MRVLVTGGGGFIGSHLVERLLQEDHEVRVIDSFVTGQRENLTHLRDAELIEGDIQSFERVHNASRGCEVILHQAALPSVPRSIADPLMTNVVNVTGTLNVLLAARDNGVRRVVHASSSSVYGANLALPKVESLQPQPISPYSVSKLAAEGYCRAFSNVYGLESVVLRYFNIFGPRQNPRSQYSAVVRASSWLHWKDGSQPSSGTESSLGTSRTWRTSWTQTSWRCRHPALQASCSTSPAAVGSR